MIVYFNHQFIPKADVRIEPDDRGFLFADGVYEVIRSYKGKLFKTDEHIARLNRSLRYLRIEIPEKINFKKIPTCGLNNIKKCINRKENFMIQVIYLGMKGSNWKIPAQSVCLNIYSIYRIMRVEIVH